MERVIQNYIYILILYTIRRWTVLSDKYLLTFEKEKVYSNPTETIDVSSIKTVKSDDNPLSFVFVSDTFLILYENIIRE